MTDFLNSKNLRQHFFYALVLGLVLRVLSAYFVYGPQALDDYLNQIGPALRMDQGLTHDLPAHRSPLMIWMIFIWAQIGGWLGISTVIEKIRWIGFGFGLTSLLAIYGAYKYFSDKPEDLTGKWTLYLMAAYGLMPFVSTRGFLESYSMGFLTAGMGVLVYALHQKKNLLIAFAFYIIGFATLIRFQIGVLYFALLIYFLFKKEWRTLGIALLTGFALMLTQLLIEYGDGRAPMSVLKAYLKMNENVSEYGVTPWYSTWLTWLALFYFPFSAGLFKHWKKWKEHGLLVWGTIFFVLIHSLVPHKEERFLYPILGLTLIMWAILWIPAWNSTYEKKFFRPVFLFLNTLLLGVGCFVNTQVGEIGVPALTQKRSDKVLYIDRDSLVGQGFMYEIFLRPPARLEKITEAISEETLNKYLPELENLDGFALMTSNPHYRNELSTFAMQTWHDFKCTNEQEVNSATDSLFYKLNPERNYRRRPTWYVNCWK